jgi:hypothetical protein
VFVTAIPDWREGDEFLAGSELQRFRIVAIVPEMGDDTPIHAAWVVERALRD